MTQGRPGRDEPVRHGEDGGPALSPKARTAARYRLRRVLVAGTGLLLVVTILAAATAWHLFGQIRRVNIRFASPQPAAGGTPGATGAAGALASTRPTAAAAGSGDQNFLLMGSDSRDFAGGQAYNVAPGDAAHVTGQRSDVVMVLHVPAGNEKATVVSFPRDSWVELPSYTDANGDRHEAVHAKLNAAFSIGGAPLLVATIENLTGLHIDHFAAVNFPGFQGMVDALGGINVCVSTTRHDVNSGDFLTSGTHHLNGTQALALVRDRESFANQDLGRIKDQEYFLSVMLRKVLSTGTLTNPIKLTDFLDVATKSVTVDTGLSIGDMRKLATRFGHLDPAHVSFLTVPVADANYQATSSVYGNQPQSNVLLDPVGSAALFAELAGGTQPSTPASSPPPPPAAVTISVENASGRTGLARSVAATLQNLGFQVQTTGNAIGGEMAHTTITYGPADLAAAQSLQAHIPGAQLQPTTTNGVVLELGTDFTAISDTATTPAPPPSDSTPPTPSCAP